MNRTGNHPAPVLGLPDVHLATQRRRRRDHRPRQGRLPDPRLPAQPHHRALTRDQLTQGPTKSLDFPVPAEHLSQRIEHRVRQYLYAAAPRGPTPISHWRTCHLYMRDVDRRHPYASVSNSPVESLISRAAAVSMTPTKPRSARFLSGSWTSQSKCPLIEMGGHQMIEAVARAVRPPLSPSESSRSPGTGGTFGIVDENRARRVVDALRERGVPAHVARVSVAQFGIRVVLSEDREAIWDSDGTAGLEAQVMGNGMLVGFVPVIEGSEDFDDEQVIDAIARTDYDQPIARQRRRPPPPAAPLPRRAASSAASVKASAACSGGRTTYRSAPAPACPSSRRR